MVYVGNDRDISYFAVSAQLFHKYILLFRSIVVKNPIRATILLFEAEQLSFILLHKIPDRIDHNLGIAIDFNIHPVS